jgi:hypothetical protein
VVESDKKNLHQTSLDTPKFAHTLRSFSTKVYIYIYIYIYIIMKLPRILATSCPHSEFNCINKFFKNRAYVFWFNISVQPLIWERCLATSCYVGKIIYFRITGKFLVTRWIHSSVFHGNQCATCCEAHANFADESACLAGDNVWNEVVTIHRSQELLKTLSSLYVDIFRN